MELRILRKWKMITFDQKTGIGSREPVDTLQWREGARYEWKDVPIVYDQQPNKI